jgi:hypothetical protein
MAKLCYFEFINKEEPIFKKGEKVIFRLKIKKFQEGYNYRVLLPIRYLGSEIAGSALSCNLNREDAIYEMDISQLIAGQYSFSIALYAINEYGTETMCDHSGIRFPIDIQEEENDGINWSRQWWGSIKFPEIKEYSDESC